MKHLSRFLCLLLMLALLLPGALAEAVEQTDDDSEDITEKVGDIFDMYQVGSMVEANGKLYTISYGPTICEYDGENWRIAVVASSFSDVLRFSEDGSFYSDETSAVLSVDEDGTLLLLYPYSDGVIDLLRVPLDGSDVTRVHSFRLAEDSSDEDGSLYFSLQGAALTSDYAYVTAYGLNPEAMYGLNQLFELNLKDGSVRKVTEDYIGIILPLDDTSLIGYYDNRYTGADDPLTALVRINRQTGLTDTLCEMESDSSFSGFTMSGTSVVFNDGSQVLRVAAPYDTVETVGYLPPAYVYTNLPGCVSGNSYYTYNYDAGLTSVDLTAPLPATVLRIDSGATSFLLTGDMEADAERDLVNSGANLKADVLQVGHHGSGTSTSYIFLNAVLPEMGIISCGVNNKYGHPHEETLSILRDAGVDVYRTDLQGTITIGSDGQNYTVGTEHFAADSALNPTDPAASSTAQQTYIGNVNSKKFHLPSCPNLPAEKNQVLFSSYEEAVEAGYTPCSSCIK